MIPATFCQADCGMCKRVQDVHFHSTCVCSDVEGQRGEAATHPDQHHEEHPALPAAAV